LETAMRQLATSSFALWDTAFSRSEQGIPINGLIWMGPYRDMEAQIREKLDHGFRCIKLKIGALNFEEEIALLKQIRHEYSAKTITLRVDANGAFLPSEAPEKLKRLSDLSLHSIEQPIKAGQWEALAGLIKTSPLPIALDEELIGVFSKEQKARLLETLMPPFLVLKPTLHGGISGCNEWIALAEARNIGWWMTSALESNIGLNAVAQFCATVLKDNPLHQGLGTGLLYSDNVEMPLRIEGEKLWFRP
jgi:L-alanine-DL-glutamate epimerase-like enolase superfamily enzyme